VSAGCPDCARQGRVSLHVEGDPALVRHPEVAAALREQLEAILEDSGLAKGPGADVVAFDDLASLLAERFDGRLHELLANVERETA